MFYFIVARKDRTGRKK